MYYFSYEHYKRTFPFLDLSQRISVIKAVMDATTTSKMNIGINS